MEKLLVGKSLEHQLDTVIKELAPTGNISYVVLQFDDEEENRLLSLLKGNIRYILVQV